MEIFTDDERIAKVYSVRHTPYVSGPRYSRNRHHFLISDATMLGAVQGCFEPIGVAEQHALMPQARIEMMVAIMLPKPTEPLENLSAICSFSQKSGGRIFVEGRPLAEWPIMLQLRKYCTYGRTSRLFYEGALADTDLVYDDAPRVHLNGTYDWTGMLSSWFNSYMLQCPLPYIAPSFPGGVEYPTGYRQVVSFGGVTAEKLTSIPGAQKRKTHRALPYQAIAQAVLEDIQIAGALAHGLAHGGYPTFSQEARQNVLSMVANVGSKLHDISDYYSDGVQPDDADCWRPSSGLNPFSLRAAQTLQICANTLATFSQSVASLPENEDGEIAALDLEGALPQYWRAIGLYMLFLDDERFTGTPRYIPRELSTCRVASV